MKRPVPVLVVLLALALAAPAMAQVANEIALTRKVVETERQAIVAENLGLSESQGQSFWPLYRGYMGERAVIGDRRVAAIRTFAESYDTMDDAKANGLVDEVLAIQKADNDVKKKWIAKMRKVLPGTTVARFFQIENKLDAFTQAALADEIPLLVKGQPVTIAPGQ